MLKGVSFLPADSGLVFPPNISQHASLSPTFLVDVEVLQALVQVAGRGDGSDVGVGVDGPQARDGRAVPHRSQIPGF